MSRRRFAAAVASAAFVFAVTGRAQPNQKPRRIGYLGSTTRAADRAFLEALLSGLRERGWFEGANLHVEYRWADGEVRRLPDLARDLLRSDVEVMVVIGTPGAQAAQRATRTVPIVFGMISDPVASGIVASLNRPGGNATGWANMLRQISAKLVELLREAAPEARRLAVLWNPESPGKQLEYAEAVAAAQALGLHMRSVEVRTTHELDAGFAAIRRDRAEALIVFIDSMTLSRKAAIVAFAARERLPAIYQWRDFVHAGGLMSYGPNAEHEWRQAAGFVDKILRGARPAELAVEQPTRFELALNVGTARALGVSLPQSLLLRADEVIR